MMNDRLSAGRTRTAMAICLVAAGLGEAAVLTAAADEVAVRSAAERFSLTQRTESGANDADAPDFQRHVVPLLGKLGCNGRACHGSFQGRGDFRLSLFGYDFKADHDELHGRLDPEQPEKSLILQKPLMEIPHEGGRRLTAGTWEHELLLSWIRHDAPSQPENAAKLTRLDVTPPEIQFRGDGQQQQLRAIAVWSDGSREDVTALCRFQTNDDQVADVTQEGLVSAGTAGDTHVVVFYDSAVVPIAVLRPVSTLVDDLYPPTPTPTRVDELVVGKLKKLGIVPSELCSDAEFLRRASLDVTGTLPTPAEVRSFLADTRSDKRARKVDELLERPGYVAWWTTKLCDYTGNSDDQLNNVTPIQNQASKQWYDWIFRRVQENAGYDDLVEGIVLAVSREPGESYAQYCENLSKLYHRGSTASLAERSYLPHYWSRLNFRTSEDRVIGFAYTFLGTRIQCAQCHKHPFDQWTQDDFQAFEGFFKGTQGQITNPRPDARSEHAAMLKDLDGTEGLKGNDLRKRLSELLADGQTVPFGEVYAVPVAKKPAGKSRNNKAKGGPAAGGPPATARLLGGSSIDLTTVDDIRRPLMDWLRSPENPLFAKAFVNRVWASYFNRGIVHPADDLNLANPPVNADLLDYLAAGFIQSDFDMKWVHRTILNSRTYQLSWQPNDTNRLDERNFSRAVPRRLPAEIVWDMMAQAVSNTTLNESFVTSLDKRALSIPGAGVRGRGRNEADYALTVFGRSVRESNCDCDRSEEPSLLQTIFVRNDEQLLSMMDQKTGWLAETAGKCDLKFQPNSTEQRPARAEPQQAQAKKRMQERMAALKKQLRVAREKSNEEAVQRLQRQITRLQEADSGEAAKGSSESDLAASQSSQKAAADAEDSRPAGWNSAELITEAYLRTLSRLPTASELQISEQYIADAKDPMEGIRSVLWALLNTKEFIVNH